MLEIERETRAPENGPAAVRESALVRNIERGESFPGVAKFSRGSRGREEAKRLRTKLLARRWFASNVLLCVKSNPSLLGERITEMVHLHEDRCARIWRGLCKVFRNFTFSERRLL